MKAYGLRNYRELFASLSVPFLRGYNDFFPFTRFPSRNLKQIFDELKIIIFILIELYSEFYPRSQLRLYDKVSFQLLKELWNLGLDLKNIF